MLGGRRVWDSARLARLRELSAHLREQRTLQWQVSAGQELRPPHVGEMLTLLENKSEDRKVPDVGFFMSQWYGSDTHSVKSVL